MTYPKRLIEVDLPIKKISAHARREKSIGHISSLHIWWARRPLAACRAVVAATLWPDPVDQSCPEEFISQVGLLLCSWARNNFKLVSAESYPVFNALARSEGIHLPRELLRSGLMSFIADFAEWGNSDIEQFLEFSAEVSKLAAKTLSFGVSESFIVLDPFAGGGSIPVETLRVGADVCASDLNPIPYLLNKALIEYIPIYGEALWKHIEKSAIEIGNIVREQISGAQKSNNREREIACIWAKTVKCTGPGCGASIPILRNLWLEKKGPNKCALVLRPRGGDILRRIDIEIELPPKNSANGTVRRGAVTCPCCGFTMARDEMERLAKTKKLGERMVAIIETMPGQKGRKYRIPNEHDIKGFQETREHFRDLYMENIDGISLAPDEELPYLRSIFNVHVYGVTKWLELFNERQLATNLLFVKTLREYWAKLKKSMSEDEAKATMLFLALAVDRQINALNRTCYWNAAGPKMQAGFARQALPMFWDYCEANPFGGSVGSWDSMIKCVRSSFDTVRARNRVGTAFLSTATAHVLPNDSVDAVITDPPYYDAVPYADLSDFFYIWLKRMLGNIFPEAFTGVLSPKESEVVQLAERNEKYSYKTKENFERLMTKAMAEARRVVKPNSVSVFVFAHQTTAGWETMLGALINAGWIVTASWPIDTEMPTRVRAQNSAVLASSIHLACRPRMDVSGQLDISVGDWRDVLAELPERIGDWLPRLASEGVVGADAIFACLGPALEIFSRYSSVEKASGEVVPLREYLEQVWAEVARQALNMIFEGADASGFEEDARLTAMWLWTLKTNAEGGVQKAESEDADENESETDGKKSKSIGGYGLEYDAARKIAQGLGCHLENMSRLVEVQGDKALLLSVESRARYLFGKEEVRTTGKGRKKKEVPVQIGLFTSRGGSGDEETESERAELDRPPAGKTVLDQLHQAMLLFTAGRGAALKQFLVDDGIGANPQFWNLAQALSALYPSHTNEKRWVDGVLARKKGLGF